MRPVISKLSLLIGSTLSISTLSTHALETHTEKTERFIVTLKSDALNQNLPFAATPQAIEEYKQAQLILVANAVNAEPIHNLSHVNAVVLTLTQEQKARLAKRTDVASIEIDPKRYLSQESTPYGIAMVQANQLSDSLTGNRKVCIMDTGYTLNHPDLPSSGITGSDGYGSNNTGNWYNDGNGHGTHVAGTIAAIGNNGQGVVGVNPSNQLGLHIVKVFNDQGRWAYGSDLIKAIDQCEQAGANVTSMSLGGSGSSTAERQAFANSYARGMLHIAAAGNDGNSSMSYPASYNDVISVAAVDSSENKASFSQYNSQVEIAGPGVSVNSTWNNNGYKSISGTSMATPHVSGVAALVWSHYPSCSNQHIRDALNATAKDKGASGRDTSYGYGIVQAKAAFDYLAQNDCGGNQTDKAPVANFNYTVSDKRVTFTDASSDDKGINQYRWQFGDGVSSNNQNPNHTYSTAGDYRVSLTVTDTKGQTNTRTQTIKVGSSSGNGCDGLSAWSASTNYTIGDKVSYQQNEYQATWWSTGATPTVYTNVWRRNGACSDAGNGNNAAPKADFSTMINQLNVSFNQQSTDDKGISVFAWAFGDGATSELASPTHRYAQAGTYTVTLTVTDGEGLSDQHRQTVTVSQGDGNTGCNGITTWKANDIYLTGDQVALNGQRYSANWWTQGDNPEENSSAWGVWKKQGACQ